jgi:hypothetical protein
VHALETDIVVYACAVQKQLSVSYEKCDVIVVSSICAIKSGLVNREISTYDDSVVNVESAFVTIE